MQKYFSSHPKMKSCPDISKNQLFDNSWAPGTLFHYVFNGSAGVHLYVLHALPFSPICQPVRSGVHLVRWAWEWMGSPVIMCHPRFFQPGLKPGEKLQDMSSVLKRWFDEIVQISKFTISHFMFLVQQPNKPPEETDMGYIMIKFLFFFFFQKTQKQHKESSQPKTVLASI